MKQADRPAHSSGCKGGQSLVFDRPAKGVLQMMPTAIDATGTPSRAERRCNAPSQGHSFPALALLLVASIRRLTHWLCMLFASVDRIRASAKSCIGSCRMTLSSDSAAFTHLARPAAGTRAFAPDNRIQRIPDD